MTLIMKNKIAPLLLPGGPNAIVLKKNHMKLDWKCAIKTIFIVIGQSGLYQNTVITVTDTCKMGVNCIHIAVSTNNSILVYQFN